MFDFFHIFTKKGLVLFERRDSQHIRTPLNDFIRDFLLEERAGETSAVIGDYKIQWTFENDFDLFFVIVYNKILQLKYVEELLKLVSSKFASMFGDTLRGGKVPELMKIQMEFDDTFLGIRDGVLKRNSSRGGGGGGGSKPLKQREFEHRDKDGKKKKKERVESQEKEGKGEAKEDEVEEKAGSDDKSSRDKTSIGVGSEKKTTTMLTKEERIQRIKDLKMRGARKGGKKPAARGGVAPTVKSETPSKGGKKVGRTWASIGSDVRSSGPIDEGKMKELDFSSGSQEDGGEMVEIEKDEEAEDNYWEMSDGESDEEDEDDDDAYEQQEKEDQKLKGRGFFGGLMDRIKGKRVLSEEDITPTLQHFKDLLVEKNVASDVAEKLSESVRTSLVGRSIGTFTAVRSAVREALTEAIGRILTPKKSVDILRDAEAAKREGRTYSLAFVGVNGVGKSTTLAKVCKYLKTNDLTCMIAACDTFRSGAVEQLRRHATALDVPLFEQGYGGDAAAVARNAIKKAKEVGIDVVLIDTAGRMQDNEPLMRALAKLITVNRPDMVLFVGESLVGHDAVDQLMKFDRALKDMDTTKGIDGIVLTKFDTIDTKVGAAISMAYTTGQPIVFVGCGQKYTDLRKLNVRAIVKILME
uniref:Signal recognition particle receptor subunit alpha n=1 Tax=Stygiella incarcerata TaxID=1712417 RepID=A0A192ZI80_9EUKA|nr:signal recognition particle receptor subunit alpha [Stygiella incarcerata]|eukprot:TRINITY_DN3389_c0_g1_i1.p1 TRINITY_DN3389_c0_g1~~TRINITY_DN3389_c0_g1_i1.p1  ORF type:complete len:640 (-),score=206.28 TRINITY_DN3389_c0_g1_i1:137-2056(-)